jgi:hypothetical protein
MAPLLATATGVPTVEYRGELRTLWEGLCESTDRRAIVEILKARSPTVFGEEQVSCFSSPPGGFSGSADLRLRLSTALDRRLNHCFIALAFCTCSCTRLYIRRICTSGSSL